MRSKSYYFLLLVLGLGLLSGLLFTQKEFHYGLDVKGGIRLTYEMDLSKLTPEQKTNVSSIRENLLSILSRRAVGPLGVAEPTILAKGDSQFIVELPGLTDLDKAMAVIGSSARIEFFDASNVVSKSRSYAPYTTVDEPKKDDPSVSFRKTSGLGDTIRYGSAEYASIIKGWAPILAGTDLETANVQPKGEGYQPEMIFSLTGQEKIRRWSLAHQRDGENLATVLDGKVLSIAPLKEGAVLEREAVIDGQFSAAWVTSLVDKLKSGSLPVDLKPLSQESVDPTIGSQALGKMVTAGMVSFGIIALFLIAYYSFPGFVALIALLLYVLFTLTVLKLINATFSLAAIAGFILSVGMAVDANILVFERFKEEIKSGKSLASAIELGFRRALPAIVDSNACTMLTSLVLVNIGTGPVKGFATTLIIGVAISLFTAVTVTRSLLKFSIGAGIASDPKWYALDRNWFGKLLGDESEPLRVVEKYKKWFLYSIITIVISIPFFFMGGFKPNVEFQGGTELQYAVNDASATGPAIQAKLESGGYRGANVQLGSGKNEKIAYITIPASTGLTASDTTAIQKIADVTGLKATDNRGFTSIGASVQKETLRNAITGVLVSSSLIILYLAFRFGIGFGGFNAGLRFGVSAIGALGHDILVVFGTSAIFGFLFHWEVSALFLTAMLTMIGFSVHDTIVVFDRIRENLRRVKPGEDFGHLCDRSITQSFARSINTSMTVIVTLAILVAIGTPTPELKFFVVAMLVGIISGTYSSLYNASPILYLWDRAAGKKGHEHTLIGMAHQDVVRNRVITTATTTIGETPVTPSAPQPPQQPQSPTGRTYGQVRRRANSAKASHQEIEDDDL